MSPPQSHRQAISCDRGLAAVPPLPDRDPSLVTKTGEAAANRALNQRQGEYRVIAITELSCGAIYRELEAA